VSKASTCAPIRPRKTWTTSTTQQAGANLPSAAHSGEDVGVFADGPGAYLVHGVVEESYIFQVMRHAYGFDAGK
jgi:alkaline phosphatase